MDIKENNISSDILEMKFDPNTIRHLGVQMYSTLPPVISEIIANSYDADAEEVIIYFNDQEQKEIIITDNGHGMDFKDLNKKFLFIGRNRRENNDEKLSPEKHRPVIGKKGLGKLSFFGIAGEIIIDTVRNGKKNIFSMNIEDIKKEKTGNYKPSIIEKDKDVPDNNGTKVILRDLKRKTAFTPKRIATSLARTFSIFNEKDFKVTIIHNNEKTPFPITNDLKYADISILEEWTFPLDESKETYKYAESITGKIISSRDNTIPSSIRGISLFSRGKLVNEHSFYDVKATSHGYSYITGTLDISFIDDWDKDVISTNRKSLNWEDEDTIELKNYLNIIIRHIYNEQRKLKENEKKATIKKKTGLDVDDWIKELPKHEQKLANNMLGNILKSEEIDEDKATDLILYIKDSFQYESFKEFAAELDEIEEITNDNLIKLLQDWELIEAREFYKLSLVRIEAIKKFEIYIKNNAKEIPTLHDFLKSFSWLLDPRIIEFEDEVYYSNLLREKYPEEDIKVDSDKRIDFLCTTLANTLFIIELKRPHHTITEKNILQANEYRSFVQKLQGSDKSSVNQVVAYIICGNRNNRDAVKDLVNQVEKSGDIYIKTYHELLTKAQKYHKEFIDKYNNFRK
jgi:hypothetical protein